MSCLPVSKKTTTTTHNTNSVAYQYTFVEIMYALLLICTLPPTKRKKQQNTPPKKKKKKKKNSSPPQKKTRPKPSLSSSQAHTRNRFTVGQLIDQDLSPTALLCPKNDPSGGYQSPNQTAGFFCFCFFLQRKRLVAFVFFLCSFLS